MAAGTPAELELPPWDGKASSWETTGSAEQGWGQLVAKALKDHPVFGELAEACIELAQILYEDWLKIQANQAVPGARQAAVGDAPFKFDTHHLPLVDGAFTLEGLKNRSTSLASKRIAFQAAVMKLKFGASWADNDKMGATKEQHRNIVKDQTKKAMQQFLALVFTAFTKALKLDGNISRTPEQNAYADLLRSPLAELLKRQQHWDDSWITDDGIHLIPLTGLWLVFLIKNKNSGEGTSRTFFPDLYKRLCQADQPTTQLLDWDMEMTSFFAQWLENFPDIASVQRFLRVAQRQHIIDVGSTRPGAEGKAYTAARSHVIHHSQPGEAPSLAVMDEAIRMGNEHITSFADASPQAAGSNAELQKAQEQVRALQAQLEQQGAAPNQGGRKQQQRKPVARCDFCSEKAGKEVRHPDVDMCYQKAEHVLELKKKRQEKRQKQTAKKALQIKKMDELNDSKHYYLIPWTADRTQASDLPLAQDVALLTKTELGPALDSGAQVHVTGDSRRVVKIGDKTYWLKGIHGTNRPAQEASLEFPVTLHDGTVWLLGLGGQGLFSKGSPDSVLSLALLKRLGFREQLEVGTPSNPRYGGTLTTPCNRVMILDFNQDMWRIPLWAPAKTQSGPRRHGPKSPKHVSFASTNPFDLLSLAGRTDTHISDFPKSGGPKPQGVEESADLGSGESADPGSGESEHGNSEKGGSVEAHHTSGEHTDGGAGQPAEDAEEDVVQGQLGAVLAAVAKVSKEEQGKSVKLRVLPQPRQLSAQQRVQIEHDSWGHPSETMMRRIMAKYPNKFPKSFKQQLSTFSCQSCVLTSSAGRYKHTKAFRKKQQASAELDDAIRQAYTASWQEDDQGEQPTSVGAGQAKDIQELGLTDLLPQEHDPEKTELHMDRAHAIALGFHKQKYYIAFVLGANLFVWNFPCASKKDPIALLEEFLALTGVKLTCIRVDNAGEFARNSALEAWAAKRNITIRPTISYAHTMQARVESSIRVTKDHVRAMLKASNLPKCFWPWVVLQFSRVRAYWPNEDGVTGWDNVPNHQFSQSVHRDLIPPGCWIAGHLTREHPLVQEDVTHADRADEGVFLAWDLTTPTAWLYSFKRRKIVRMDVKAVARHLYPFRDPTCVVNRQSFTWDHIHHLQNMSPEDFGPEDGAPVTRSSAKPQSPAIEGEKSASEEQSRAGNQAEQQKGDQRQESEIQQPSKLARKSKTPADISLDTPLQKLTDRQLADVLAHYEFTFKLPHDYWKNPKTDQHQEVTVKAKKGYTIKKYSYLDVVFVSPEEAVQYAPMQLPVSAGKANMYSRWNLRIALDHTFKDPKTLRDLGINEDTRKTVAAATVQAWERSSSTGAKQQAISQKHSDFIKALIAGTGVADRQKPETQQVLDSYWSQNAANFGSKEKLISNILLVCTALLAFQDGESNGEYESILFAPEDHKSYLAWLAAAVDEGGDQTLQDKMTDDALEPDPRHRKEALAHPRFRKFWLEGEKEEWDGLWGMGCFKKWNRKDLLPSDKVFGSRFHYHIKRDAITGVISRFKVRLVVQGQNMVEKEDYECAFAPVPHSTCGRLVMSMAVANDWPLHKCDLTKAFVQADRLPEGRNGRVFIRPPPGSSEDDPDVVYEVLRPLYGVPSSAKALNVTLHNYLTSLGFKTVGFEESVWVRPAGGRYSKCIMLSAHIDDNLITAETTQVLEQFKRDFLSRFKGTDEGEVSQYLGCEFVRDRAHRTGELKQTAYAKRLLQKFDMWEAMPVKTPLEPGYRLSKDDCPEKVDPELQRKFRMITGGIGWLANMTRPDLAFAHNELSKFLQYPGEAHMKCAIRVLQYLRGTYNLGLKWHDPGRAKRNVLEAFVDSDYAACKDTRRSQTGFLVINNGGPVSWSAKRQAMVTLSSQEAEFVAASQLGVELLYLRTLMRDFGYEQKKPTVTWEDNAATILLSKNPVNRQASRHIDTRVHFLRDLVKDKVMELHKCAGTNNPSDALTKSVPGPTLEKHREFMMGTTRTFQAFQSTAFEEEQVGDYLGGSLTPFGSYYARLSS